MKLSEEVLVEIIDIVRQGIVEGKDVSDLLRELDLEPGLDTNKLNLTFDYKSKKGRTA